MTDFAELASRCDTENPLEVYYDVIDAMYSTPISDATALTHVLTGLQTGVEANAGFA